MNSKASTKHTPGPWKILKQEPQRFPGFEIETADHKYVAEVKIHAHNNAFLDARLIAAAPELLEAAQHFAYEDAGDDRVCHKGIMTKEKCGRCGPILRARAAIAKATGES